MKTVLLTSSNFVLQEHMLEHPDPVSVTIPGEVVDLASLIKRSLSGQSITGFDDGYSDEDFPDLHTMDTLDIMTMRHDNLDYIAELQAKEEEIARELAERKKKERDAQPDPLVEPKPDVTTE